MSQFGSFGKKGLQSSCFSVDVSVKSPGQVFSGVNAQEPESVDTVHCHPLDDDGDVSSPLLLPVVQYQPLGFGEAEPEVVVLAAEYQGCHHLAVYQPIGDQANDVVLQLT